MIDLLSKRRSIRKYKDKMVEDFKVEQILRGALLAPSSMNKKPVEFVVVNDKYTLKQLEDCKDKGTIALKTAPLAIVVIADFEKSNVWIEDASIASSNIMLEAENLGLGTCWIQIRNRQNNCMDSEDAVRKVLNIPSNMGVLNIITLGYKDEEKASYNLENLNFTKIHYNKY
ncbi:nitroreductase family protein [Clostridium sp. Ade.TY]|uniref:nitroreductase family protein n=1 Tax=Clostridium sp. Ade.TY TaxID=1391647 RepID=UPI00041FB646|nr:nitroreductase family protein [Clostridium sp. Ade.TY]